MTILKVDGEKRLKLEDVRYAKKPVLRGVRSRLNSIKKEVQRSNSVQQAWESLNSQIGSNNAFSVDERTMGSRDLVKELTQINLDAQNQLNITHGTGLHDQKLSNLCVYFATLSALRHEIKNLFNNLSSMAVNFGPDMRISLVSIPAGKSIDELFKEKEFDIPSLYSSAKIPNALSFERMLSVLLGCVSPKALSGSGQNLKDVYFLIISIGIKINNYFMKNYL